VPKLGERGRSKRNLRERRQTLIDEALQPAQSGALVAFRIGRGE
jgi:hypothetical protein